VLNPEHADKLATGLSQAHTAPTYNKVHRSHVDVETLRYFGLPWEYDSTDTNYIVILQELESHETELLFEHTRKLRRGGSQVVIEDRETKHDQKDYAFVRKKKHQRSPSMLTRRSSLDEPRPPALSILPPIHQEVITHHRHIDHTVEPAPSFAPPLPAPGGSNDFD